LSKELGLSQLFFFPYAYRIAQGGILVCVFAQYKLKCSQLLNAQHVTCQKRNFPLKVWDSSKKGCFLRVIVKKQRFPLLTFGLSILELGQFLAKLKGFCRFFASLFPALVFFISNPKYI